MPFPSLPKPEPTPPDRAAIEQDLRLALQRERVPDAEIPALVKAHIHRIGVYAADPGISDTELPSGGRALGPGGVALLARELGVEWERDQRGPRPATELRKALEALGAPPAVIEASLGRVWRELGAEPERDVVGRRPGGPVLRADLATVVRQVAEDVMAEHLREQRRRAVSPESENEMRQRFPAI